MRIRDFPCVSTTMCHVPLLYINSHYLSWNNPSLLYWIQQYITETVKLKAPKATKNKTLIHKIKQSKNTKLKSFYITCHE